MKYNDPLLVCILGSFLVVFACKKDSSVPGTPGQLPLEKSIKSEEVFKVDSYSEGIVFDAEGFGFISVGDQVIKFHEDGTKELWAKVRGANGHKILKDGSHLVCSMEEGKILRLDSTGKLIENFSTQSEGKPLRAPNDLTLDPYGGVYFTDPRGFSGSHDLGTIHYIDTTGETMLVADNLAVPNGIVCLPGGNTLIVALSGANQIVKYPVISPGKLGKQEIFASLPSPLKPGHRVLPDGLCLDTNGNIYVAHYGTGKIRVLSADGQLVRSYEAGNLIVSNLAFGSLKKDYLFTTGSIIERPGAGGVFKLHLPGVEGVRNADFPGQ